MTTSFTKAAKEYFGKKEGQSLQDFASELNALTEQDKIDLAAGLAIEMGDDVEVVKDDKTKVLVKRVATSGDGTPIMARVSV